MRESADAGGLQCIAPLVCPSRGSISGLGWLAAHCSTAMAARPTGWLSRCWPPCLVDVWEGYPPVHVVGTVAGTQRALHCRRQCRRAGGRAGRQAGRSWDKKLCVAHARSFNGSKQHHSAAHGTNVYTLQSQQLEPAAHTYPGGVRRRLRASSGPQASPAPSW
jgi:hypothetical protein